MRSTDRVWLSVTCVYTYQKRACMHLCTKLMLSHLRNNLEDTHNIRAGRVITSVGPLNSIPSTPIAVMGRSLRRLVLGG